MWTRHAFREESRASLGARNPELKVLSPTAIEHPLHMGGVLIQSLHEPISIVAFPESWTRHLQPAQVIYVIAGTATITLDRQVLLRIGIESYFYNIPTTMFTAFRSPDA